MSPGTSHVPPEHVAAARTGDLNYLQGLGRESFMPHWESRLCQEAALYGQLQVLQWSQSQQPSWQINASRCAVLALQLGYQELLEWLLEKFQNCLHGSCAESEAAGLGFVTALRGLKAYNPQGPWNSTTPVAAARWGHMEVLEFLQSHDPPCQLNTKVSAAAAGQGNLAMLKWLRHQTPPCPIEEAAVIAAYAHQHMEIVQWILHHDLLDPAALENLAWWALCVDAPPLMESLRLHGLLARVDAILCARSFAEGDPLILENVAPLFHRPRLLGLSIIFTCKATSVIRCHEDLQFQGIYVLASKPHFLDAVQWLMYLPTTISHECKLRVLTSNALAQKSFLPVQLAARGMKLPIAAETWSLAAAHSNTTLLRWLVAQPPSPGHTKVHKDCSDARLLLLVHGHQWGLPEFLQGRLAAAEQRRLAFFCAAKRQGNRGQGQMSLSQLPADLVKYIACKADIDFDWHFSK